MKNLPRLEFSQWLQVNMKNAIMDDVFKSFCLKWQYFYNTFSGPYDDERFFDLDAALITLPKSFNLDHFVNAVCLPNKFGLIDESWNGKMFTITGFGQIKDKVLPKKLQLGQKSMINDF